MLSAKRTETASFQADYATQSDFCAQFEADTKPLYLLAFLLTTNHADAEKCFISTVEESSHRPRVFKEWVQLWIKRTLIKNAIRIVAPGRASTCRPDEWGTAEIDGVTRLPALERFSLVMTVLENYSTRDCALLLGVGQEKVAWLRSRALNGLPSPDAIFPIPIREAKDIAQMAGH